MTIAYDVCAFFLLLITIFTEFLVERLNELIDFIKGLLNLGFILGQTLLSNLDKVILIVLLSLVHQTHFV